MAYSYEEMDKLQACLRCGRLLNEIRNRDKQDGLEQGPGVDLSFKR
jgi:hypothetical protein